MNRTPITKTPLARSRRRFGLSRSIKKPITSKNELISTPDSSHLLDIVSTPNFKVIKDISPSPMDEINTKNIKEPQGIHMEQIPDLKTNSHPTPSLETKSTISRKKYLGLTKHRKDKILKKKIDFTRTMDSEQCIPSSSDSQQKMIISQDSSTSMELEVTKDHSERVNKLKGLISIWKNGLIDGLNILSTKTDPATDVEDICKELNIPLDFVLE